MLILLIYKSILASPFILFTLLSPYYHCDNFFCINASSSSLNKRFTLLLFSHLLVQVGITGIINPFLTALLINLFKKVKVSLLASFAGLLYLMNGQRVDILTIIGLFKLIDVCSIHSFFYNMNAPL